MPTTKPKPKSKPKAKPKAVEASVEDLVDKLKKKTAPSADKVNIDKLIKRGDKLLGDGRFMRLSEDPAKVTQRYSTGIAALDIAISGKRDGGIPSGRISTIYGSESVGKTTLGCMLMQTIQSVGGVAFIIDTEQTLQSGRASQIGVKTSDVIYIDEEYLEPAFDAILMTVSQMKQTPGMVFFDTIAGTQSIHDRGRDVGDNSRMSIHSLQLSKAMRMLSRKLSRSNFVVLLCNQLKTGAIGDKFASERERNAMIGSKPIRFHSEVIMRIEYLRKFYVTHGGQKVERGFEVKVTVEKNKSGAPNVSVRLVFATYNNGKFDDALSALYTLRFWGVIPKSSDGTSISYRSEKLSIKKWRTRYDTDPAFKSIVCSDLEAAFAERYST